ncbi:MAG: hypothetical protein NVS1B3_02360 [Candidatus Dormibacteraceae bacterium]
MTLAFTLLAAGVQGVGARNVVADPAEARVPESSAPPSLSQAAADAQTAPVGKYTGTVANEIAAAGYHNATTTAWGAWHSLGDRFVWGRLRAGGGQSLGDYATSVQISAS